MRQIKHVSQELKFENMKFIYLFSGFFVFRLTDAWRSLASNELPPEKEEHVQECSAAISTGSQFQCGVHTAELILSGSTATSKALKATKEPKCVPDDPAAGFRFERIV